MDRLSMKEMVNAGPWAGDCHVQGFGNDFSHVGYIAEISTSLLSLLSTAATCLLSLFAQDKTVFPHSTGDGGE